MAKISAFEKHRDRYEEWFKEHGPLYEEELRALRRLLPPFEKGVEIGVGTGRFAEPLGIKEGVEPSPKMAEVAKERGIEVAQGVAEALPLEDESYDLALMVTTICFVDDPRKALREIYRILKPGGYMLLGFVDKETPLGRLYQKNREKSRFYKEATFYSTQEVLGLLKEAGFGDCKAVQTLFGPDLEHMEGGVKEGYGEGAFVALRCQKP
ncbi:class I SAM-dependent methyltransferase [Hydrogenimonas sp.]